MRKTTYQKVFNYFKSQNCQLLSNEYIGSTLKLDYICSCGNPSKITFANFKSGQRCKECGTKKRIEKQTLTYDYVYNYFQSQNCQLLSKEYIKNSQKLDYICSCGNKSKIRFYSFKNGQRCKECGNKKMTGKKRLSYDKVYDYFQSQNCRLLSKDYINSQKKLDYICSCGNKSKIKFGSFKEGHRCKECGNKKMIEKQTLTYDYVYNYFQSQNCQLLSKDYIKNSQKLDYICSCGNKSKMKFGSFKDGHRCKECGKKREIESKIKNGTFTCGYSKESQELFWLIYNSLPINIQNKTYFAELNSEYYITNKKLKRGFLFDFLNTKLKRCIEYNGSAFHPAPHILDDDITWFAFHKTQPITAKEKRYQDKLKLQTLKEEKGIETLVIWDFEEDKLEKCLDFLSI